MPLQKRQRESFLDAPHPDDTLMENILQLLKSYWKNCVSIIRSLPQAGFFLEESMPLGNNSKSKKSFLEALHQDETLMQNIWQLLKGYWK